VFVVRPLCAWVSTQGSTLSINERHFIAWVAPRGIVAAAITSLTADVLTQRGLEGGEELRGLVFLTIASTVVLAGLTARPVANLLKLRLPGRNRVAILHADGLGIALGGELKRHGVPVVFIDSDPKRCRSAQEQGYNVVFGDALEERVLSRAQFELVGTAIGLSGNDHLNSLFVSHAREYFGVPKSLVALEALPSGGLPKHLKKIDADILFDGPHDAERWDVRLRHNQIKVAYFIFQPAGSDPNATATREPTEGNARTTSTPQEKFVILAVRRGERLTPMSVSFKLKPGDIAAVAVYEPEFDVVVKELETRGWKHPAVSAVPEKPPVEPASVAGE
jgi:Trk K+ transport system NAD-binding subunit